MKSAQSRAKCAALSLTPSPDIDPETRQLALRFFPEDQFEDARSRFQRIADLLFLGGGTSFEDDEVGKKLMVVVFCDFKRYKWDEDSSLYLDKVNGMKMTKEEWKKNEEDPTVRAVTCQTADPKTKDTTKEAITMAALHVTDSRLKVLQAQWDKHHGTGRGTGWYDQNEAAYLPEWEESFKEYPNYAQLSWIQLLGELLDGTILHELTHASSAGWSTDIGGLTSYGWDNAMRIQRSDNAG
ncbi:hypothetical protein E6O75_ATG06991 [Venturia nashicola]|uniref:Uncharacterized protein n=1 Tax=Venturia nashicola TaxID=86259 RepID=A0A4Z1P5J5_9PEZI|nr:hypothetical protein E6O75_ATG06991 [Venturia nashicola]